MKLTDAKLNSIYSDSIPNGTKFIALFGDGSGATLFMIDDIGNLFHSDGADLLCPTPDCYLKDNEFRWWIKLPDSFKLWFEQKDEI